RGLRVDVWMVSVHRSARQTLVILAPHTRRPQRPPTPPPRHSPPLLSAFPRNEKPKGLEPAQPSIASAVRHPATAAQFNRRQLFDRNEPENFQGLRIQE